VKRTAGSCNWNTDWWIYSPQPWQWAWSQVSGSSNVMVIGYSKKTQTESPESSGEIGLSVN
jgi:hypothetical protein